MQAVFGFFRMMGFVHSPLDHAVDLSGYILSYYTTNHPNPKRVNTPFHHPAIHMAGPLCIMG